MIKIKVDEMAPSTEEEELKQEATEQEDSEVENNTGDKEEEKDGDEQEEADEDDEEQQVGDCTEKTEEKPSPPVAGKKEGKNPQPSQPKQKKQDTGLNLNNEVVKMRKEVKRVRALIIRKLMRQIGALKKKKGKEAEIEKNQRRAARLLEEIHAIKTFSPDLVTKTALQRTLSFEKECKNPKSTISDRALARIATHPQFKKKIEDIKAAVRAFKEERVRGVRHVERENVQNKAGKVTPQSPDKGEEKREKEEKDVAVREKKMVDDEGGDGVFKDAADATVADPEKRETGEEIHSADQKKEMQKATTARPASGKSGTAKDIEEKKPQIKDAEKKPALMSAPEVLQSKTDEEESDLESSDEEEEEKEYFDDSTEERFHKQSSQSEDSGDEDDFFVGKVSKFKKKKKKKEQKGAEVETAPGARAEPTDEVQSKLDELESRLKSKTSLQSVFCPSLSSTKPGGGRGGGRGRGGDRFRGQGKPRGGGGLSRDFSKESKFQKQERGAERNPESPEKGFPTFGRGRGRGRGNMMQRDRRGGGIFSHQAPQQALHPSWEASKKRKEQQGQILAFQGKKIKFDDD